LIIPTTSKHQETRCQTTVRLKNYSKSKVWIH
jgi:hypothetical protein